MTAVIDTEEPAVDIEKALSFVSGKVAGKYRRFTEFEDIRQELAAYIHSGDGQRAVSKLDSDGIFRLLFTAARRYAEEEKATRSGYSFDDLAWYSPVHLADLLPTALDPLFDGQVKTGDAPVRGGIASESGGLLAMVADVRTGVAQVGLPPAITDDEYESYLERLSRVLGGEKPTAPGYRRRAQSNASAISLTRALEDSEQRRGNDN